MCDGQVNCKLPPNYYKCKSIDHPTLLCHGVSTEGELRLFGYALDDLGLFQTDITVPEASSSLLSLITISGGKKTSPKIITEELRHLFCPHWNSEAISISDHEFTVVFSHPISLRYATHSVELTLALKNLTININVPTGDPSMVATLLTVWLQIRGLSPTARHDGVVCNMSKMLGMIIEVDLTSLAQEMVVHAKLKKLQTTPRMFVIGSGYYFHIPVEEAYCVLPSCCEEAGSGKQPRRDDGHGGGSGHDKPPRHCCSRSTRSEETEEGSPEQDASPTQMVPEQPEQSKRSRCVVDAGEILRSKEDLIAIAAMLEEAASVPLGCFPSLHHSSPVWSLDEGHDWAIVFCVEKDPMLEQIVTIRAKKILEPQLASVRECAAAVVDKVAPPTPWSSGIWELPALAPKEVQDRTRANMAQLRRVLSATIVVGSSSDPLEE
ncbi:hypothetical protein ZWY2020_024014 [Hordeum vulgare]|nr:hypothetical protein ZWY2020_024014 [Hordeum vulgare]